MKSIKELADISRELINFWDGLNEGGIRDNEALLKLSKKCLELVKKYGIAREDRDSLGYTMATILSKEQRRTLIEYEAEHSNPIYTDIVAGIFEYEKKYCEKTPAPFKRLNRQNYHLN